MSALFNKPFTPQSRFTIITLSRALGGIALAFGLAFLPLSPALAGNIIINGSSGTGGTVDHDVYGNGDPPDGTSISSDTPTSNSVTVNTGGTVNGDIYGGWYTYSGASDANSNTVTINGGTVTGTVYGGGYGYYYSTSDAFTGNTLNVNGSASISGGVRNFETINLNGSNSFWFLDTTPTGSAQPGVILNTNGNNVAVDGIFGNGSLTMTGAGTLSINWGITGPSPYTGDTTISAGGTLEIIGPLGPLAGAGYNYAGNIINNGALFLTPPSSLGWGGQTLSGVISGSGSLTKSGYDLLTLSGANTYTGGTTVNNGGRINFSAANNFGTGNITLNAGFLQWASGTSTDISGRLNPLGADGGYFDTNGNNVTLASAISGAGALIKRGEGTLTLNGTNIYSGGTRVDEGILAGNITANTNLTVGTGATYDTYGAARSVDSLDGNGNIINTDGLTVQSSAYGYSGVISGTGSLTKTSAGILTLTGNNTYTGGTTVSAGTLQIGNFVGSGSGTSGSIIGDITNNAYVTFNRSDAVTYGGVISGTGSLTMCGIGGTLTLSGANTYTGNTNVYNQGTLKITGTLGTGNIHAGNFQSTNSGTLLFDQNVNQTLSGNISTGLALTKTGAGTLTLSGTNTYTGGTTINAGTLSIGSDSNIGTGINNTLAGGTLQLTGTTYSKPWTLDAGANAIETTGSATLSGTLTGTGGFAKRGDGTLTLSGANSYDGLTEVREGILALSGSGRISPMLDLYGGTTFNTGGTTVNYLNRLNVLGPATWTGNLSMAAGQAMNFYLPDTIKTISQMLEVDDTADIDGSTVNVGVVGSSPALQEGDSVNLIKAGTLTGAPANDTSNGEGLIGTHGVTLRYEFDLRIENDFLIATITKVDAGESNKAFSEGFLAGLALVNQGADLVAGPGLAEAVGAAGRAGDSEAAYGLGAFGAIAGGWSRYDTGSHVDMSSVSLLTGLAWGRDFDPGRLTLGAFFEYGNGSYDTYNSFADAASVHGDGDARHLGGGLLGRLDFTGTGPGRLYTEASFRAGGLSNEYRNGDLQYMGRQAEYDSSSAYYGFHLGTGYVWNITDQAGLDLYGKYFWTRVEGDSVNLSTGERYTFKDAASSRLRLGGRLAYAVNDMVSPYVGAAYEHEFNGKARATATLGPDSFDIDAPSLRGGTGLGELGLSLKPSPTLPLSLDIGLQGYTGKREGVTGSLQVKWEF